MFRITHLRGLGLDASSLPGGSTLASLTPDQIAAWGEQGCSFTEPYSKECLQTGVQAAAVLAASQATGIDPVTVQQAANCMSGDPEGCARSAAVAGATYACVAGVSAVGLPIAAPLCGTVAGEIVGIVWEPLMDLGKAAEKGLAVAMDWMVPDSIQAKGKTEYTGKADPVAARLANLYAVSIDRINRAAQMEADKRKVVLANFDAESFLLERMGEDWFKSWSYSMVHTNMTGVSPSWVPVGGARGNGWWNAPILEGVVSRNMWIAIPEGAPTKVDTPYWRYNYGWGGWPGLEPAPYKAFVDALSNLYTQKRVKPLQEAVSRAIQDLTGQVAIKSLGVRNASQVKPSVASSNLTRILGNRVVFQPSALVAGKPRVDMSRIAARVIAPPKKVRRPPVRALPAGTSSGDAWKWGAAALAAAAVLGGVWYATRQS